MAQIYKYISDYHRHKDLSMTPAETAKELVDKYWIHLRAGLLYDEEAKEDAKQCALIAVNEIVNALPILRPTQDAVDYLEKYSEIQTALDNLSYYWNEVKQEIEKL